MSKVLRIVGAQVRLLRKARKLSQEQLAERAKLQPGMIGAFERGSRNITLLSLNKIAKGLAVPLRDLCPLETRRHESAGDLMAILAVSDQMTSELILSVARLIQEKRRVEPGVPVSAKGLGRT